MKSNRLYHIVILAIVASYSYIIFFGGCEKNVSVPLIQINWPKKYSDFKNSGLIQVSGLQNEGMLKKASEYIPEGDGAWELEKYSLEDAKHKCHGALACVVDTRVVGEVSVLVCSTMPFGEIRKESADYIIKDNFMNSNGWSYYKITKTEFEKKLPVNSGAKKVEPN